MNNILAFCCIIAVLSNNVIIDYSTTSSKHTYIHYLNGTTIQRNNTPYEQYNSCDSGVFDFRGDYVDYYVPYGSNMTYDEAGNTPMNLSMVFEKKVHYREPYYHTFKPIYKSYISKSYCGLLKDNFNTQSKNKVKEDG